MTRAHRSEAVASLALAPIEAPASLFSITPLPEVTVLPPEEGWPLWDMAVRLQDAAAGVDLRSAA